MARILIVAGGCRGRRLASALTEEGHAARVTTRTEGGRAAIEVSGAECFIGDPDRLATLMSSLEQVTIVCWLLGSASGSPERVRALHSSRLELFLGHAVDTTVRGFVYEARGTTVPRVVLAEGQRAVSSVAHRNSIPVAFLTADPEDPPAWSAEARAAVNGLLGGATGAQSNAARSTDVPDRGRPRAQVRYPHM